jgi:7-cyano-7-deazaguanine synthase
MEKAIILLSGGMDSATALAVAKDAGFECYALSGFFGQRHQAELDAARKVAQAAGVKEHRFVNVNFGQWGGSALTDQAIQVPTAGTPSTEIPVTYVPARNTIFLALALSWAEAIGASDIFTGVNAVDYSGYPDCRPAFIEAFEKLANVATKRSAVDGIPFHIHAPLITLTKAEIVKLGMSLGVDYSLTVSCYQADDQGRACGVCDSCRLRHQGFVDAGVPDPTRYLQVA